jgi:hypothetical protein
MPGHDEPEPEPERDPAADTRFAEWIESLDPDVPMPGPAFDREQVVSLHRDAQLYQRMTAVHQVQMDRSQAAGVSVDRDSDTERKFQDNYAMQSKVLSRQIDLTGVTKTPDGRTWGEPSDEMLAEVNAMEDREVLAEYRLYGSFIHAGDITSREDEQRAAGREHAARGGHFGHRDLAEWESSFTLAAPEDAAVYAPENDHDEPDPADDPFYDAPHPGPDPDYESSGYDPELHHRATRLAELSAELERVRQERDDLLLDRDKGWAQYSEWMRSEQRGNGNGDAAASADRDVDDGPNRVEQLADITTLAGANGADHDHDWEGFDR